MPLSATNSRWIFLLLLTFRISNAAAVAAEPIRFNRDIRPILAENCLHCHGPDAARREGNLRLDQPPGNESTVIVPGNPAASSLLERIRSTDPDLRMPPPDSGHDLSAEQIHLLQRWIQQGAEWQGHWAFEPIQQTTARETDSRPGQVIDALTAAALQQRGLKISPPISKLQWIRRVTLNLTGLPPEWADVQSYLQDESPDADLQVINRLLDSSAYGERWGRYWLDIARYADTHGGAAIGFQRFPFSWTFRDYVIRSLNKDVPWDRFITEQLAADQLDLSDNDPALAGLGFLTVGMQFRNPHDTIDDQIDVITRGLLGLTVSCARCHDHKYDPIPTADYYSLYTTLAASSSPDLLPVVGTPEPTDALRQYQEQLHRLTIRWQDMARDQSEVMRSRLRMQTGRYLRELARRVPEQDLSAAFLSYRTDDLRPLVLNRWRDYLFEMPADDPVFGAWVQLLDVPEDNFSDSCQKLLQQMLQENGDLTKLPAEHLLSSQTPKWNPRVLEAIEKAAPKTMLDVADAYGKLFAEVHQQWLQTLLQASGEAVSAETVIPDQDGRHLQANSGVLQQLRRHLYQPDTPTAMPLVDAVKLLNRTVRDNLSGRKGAIHNLHLNSPGSPPRAMVLNESDQPQPGFIFRRGSPIDRGETVPAAFLSILTGPERRVFEDGKRRLGLAQSLTAANNPLTRRVIVNWVWKNHFGSGLVRTPDDFGTRGSPPANPDLLDYLAEVFAQDGWSLKNLHRRILLSDTWRQSAREDLESRTADSMNELFWRMPRVRLDLEAMRDSMLAVSGELDRTMGGRPFEFLATPVVPRRSIYAFINRDIISPLSSTFDAANPNACTAKRPETTVPQQTLFALNSDFIQDRATAFAALAKTNAPDSSEQRVVWMYRRALTRDPGADELHNVLKFVHSTDTNAASEGDPWQQLAHVLLASNEFVFPD